MDERYNEYLRKHYKSQNKGSNSKDSEMTKTYKCEWAVQKQFGDNIRRFDSIEEAQKRCNQIVKSSTWRKVAGYDREIKLYLKKRNTGAGLAGQAFLNSIRLDKHCGLNEMTLLHEMAHCAGNMHHGRSFRKDYLALVGQFMGRECKEALQKEFRKAGLKYGEARKPLSYDQWLEKREHLERVRDGNTRSKQYPVYPNQIAASRATPSKDNDLSY